MPRSFTDEAIVLRTYNVGETDRFCILLTKSHGRLAARAHGVRRLTSRRGGGLLPLHRVLVTCETHSFGMTINAASCLDAHASCWSQPQAFACAERATELLLALTDDGTDLDAVYRLTCDFLSLCRSPHAEELADLFTVKLFIILGTFPSMQYSCISDRPLSIDQSIVFSAGGGGFALPHEDPSGCRLSPELMRLLRAVSDSSLAPVCDTSVLTEELASFVQGLLGSQLGVSLSVPAVLLSMSSSVTPTCTVSGRAS